MLARVLKKLAAKRGASLSIALLLLLVCTVVAAVVLIAGTTVSGRFASLAKMDQRYYSIVSAVELVKDQVSTGECLEVNESLDYTKSTTKDANGNEVFSYAVTGNATTVSLGGTAVSSYSALQGRNIPITLGRYFVYGTSTTAATSWAGGTDPMDEDAWQEQLDAWHDTLPTSGDGANNLVFNLTVSGSGNDEGLAVRVEAALSADGTVKLTFTNAIASGENAGETAGLTYMASMTLEPDFGTAVNDADAKATKTSTLRWTINEGDISLGTVSST